MDWKEKLDHSLTSKTERRARPGLIYALGVFGLVLIAVAGWLYFTDVSASRSKGEVAERVELAAGDLTGPVDAVKRLLNDEKVQALALRALDNADASGDLFAYINGRLSAVGSAVVFGREQAGRLNPATLGPNGYALLDLVLAVLDGKQGLMQLHGTLQPPQLFDAVALRSGEDTVAVLVVGMDPAAVLGGFQPEKSGLKFLRLSQYNGRLPATTLAEFGTVDGAPVDRTVVPGTMFRLEYPQARHVSLVTGGNLVMVVVVGLLCLAAAFVLHRRFRAQARPEGAELAPERAKGLPAKSVRSAQADALAAVDEPEVEDAQFVDLEAAVEAQAAGAPETSEEPEAETAVERPVTAPPPPMHLHYDIAQRYRQRESEHDPVPLSPEIFRAYDIRGVIDKTLDSGVARKIGQAVGSLALERNAGPVVVARDGRLSGPYLMDGVIEGVTSTGCDVLDIGAVPTGVLYFAAHEIAAGSGVMITGSHNRIDPQRNP